MQLSCDDFELHDAHTAATCQNSLVRGHCAAAVQAWPAAAAASCCSAAISTVAMSGFHDASSSAAKIAPSSTATAGVPRSITAGFASSSDDEEDVGLQPWEPGSPAKVS